MNFFSCLPQRLVSVDEISEELMESLDSHIVFTIPVFGGIPVSDAVVVTWIIMAIMVIAAILLVRGLKKVPEGKQCLLEIAVEWMYGFVTNSLGEKGKRYVPYLGTILVYIGIANIFGIFGFYPPTKNINITIALALMSIVLIQISGIQAKGVGGWLKGFAQPMPMLLPLNVMELVIKPLSLCMRLFGNVLGAFVIMKLIEIVCPLIVSIPFSLYFDFFDGFIQAYVFVFLTIIFMSETMEEE